MSWATHMCLVGLGVGAGDVVRPAGEMVGCGGAGVGAATGCGGTGTGAGSAICGMGNGAVAPETGGVGTGTGPRAGPIEGVGPPELGTGIGRFKLSTVGAGVDGGAATPPASVSARTEIGTTTNAIPIAMRGAAEKSAVLRWAVRLRPVMSAPGVAIAAPRTYHMLRVGLMLAAAAGLPRGMIEAPEEAAAFAFRHERPANSAVYRFPPPPANSEAMPIASLPCSTRGC
jgi:hypothetical protein